MQCIMHQGEKRWQLGFTVIELLVSMVIVSIGLLGLIGLQLAGVRGNHSAYQRSQATTLAQDLIERIRANPPRANITAPASVALDLQNLYSNFASAGYDCNNSTITYCADRAGADALPCNAFQMAAFDMHTSFCGAPYGSANNDSRGGVRDLLQSGALTVNCNTMVAGVCALGATHTVAISWTESDSTQSQSFVARSVTVTF